MNDATRLIEHRLTMLFDLDPKQSHQILTEVLDALSWTVDDYIAERHTALQRLGWKNERIYQQIGEELKQIRFKSPDLSARQIRRRIYG